MVRLRGALHDEAVELWRGLKNVLPFVEAEEVEEEVDKYGQFQIEPASASLIVIPETDDITQVDVRYPLLQPFADAHIYWSEEEEELIYEVEEPTLTDREQEIFDRIRDALEKKISVPLSQLETSDDVVSYLQSEVKDVLDELGYNLTESVENKLMYYVYRNFGGLNEIEPMMHDPYIEDIGCSGTSIPVYVIHTKFGSIKTGMVFNEEDNLRNLIVKLAERANKYVSYSDPLLDGTLPDGSRVNASLTSDVTTKGPTFSIRKFQEVPFSAVDLLDLGTADLDIMAFMWMCFEYQKSALVIGGTATGKCIAPDDNVHLGDGRILSAETLHREIEQEQEARTLFTMHENLSAGPKTVNRFYKLENDGSVYRVRTERGCDITVTPEHPFIVNRDGNVEYVDAEELEEETFLAAPRTLTPNTERQVINPLDHDIDAYAVGAHGLVQDLIPGPATETAEELGVDGKAVREWAESNAVPWTTLEYLIEREGYDKAEALDRIDGMSGGHTTVIDIPTEVTSELAATVGHTVADGNIEGNYVHFHNETETLLSVFQENVETVFGVRGSLRDYDRTPRITVASKALREFLSYVFEIPADTPKAGQVSTPDSILRSPNDVTAAYLRALFDCEADVSKKQTEITFNTASRQLGEEVVNLLHRHGIIARKRTRDVNGDTHHRIVISGKEQNRRFLEEIGFDHPEKREAVEKRIQEATSSHTNVDRVPCRDILASIKEEHGMSNRDIAEAAGCGRRTIDRILAGERIPSRETVHRLSSGLPETGEERERLRQLADGDVFWDPVKEIEEIPPEEAPGYVYDVTVDGTHTFTAGSAPLFVHNTTFLNSVVSFIPPEMKIVSIEDTRELQLPHENWIPSVTRSAAGDDQDDITMYELLRESFRQNPDYVVVGEVRGKEASVLFQGMASGHPSLSTMHASTPADVVSRLTTPPINLSPSLIQTLDMIVSMTHAREWGENSRRVQAVYEIEDISDEGTARTNEYFSWTSVDDTFSEKSDSTLLDSIQHQYGLDQKEIREEIENRKRVLEWLHEKGYTHFKKVSSVVSEYYKNKSAVMKMVSEQTSVGFEDVISGTEEEMPPQIERERANLEQAVGKAPTAEKSEEQSPQPSGEAEAVADEREPAARGPREEPGSESVDYYALTDNPVETVRERVEREGIDPRKVMEAEKADKNREELVRWLRGKIERQDMEDEKVESEEKERNVTESGGELFEGEGTAENPFE